MSATHENLKAADVGGEDAEQPQRPGARAARRGRALAMLVALAVVAVLALGSLADGLVATPQTGAGGAMTQQAGLLTVSLAVDSSPQQASQSGALLVQVTDVSGVAVDGVHAQCALSMPAMGMTFAPVTATPTGQPGHYQCASQALSAGAWTLALTLTMPSGETAHATFQFVVA
jgi:nitrogen fixation protein FixH